MPGQECGHGVWLSCGGRANTASRSTNPSPPGQAFLQINLALLPVEGCMTRGSLCRGCIVFPFFKRSYGLWISSFSLSPSFSDPLAFCSPAIKPSALWATQEPAQPLLSAQLPPPGCVSFHSSCLGISLER